MGGIQKRIEQLLGLKHILLVGVLFFASISISAVSYSPSANAVDGCPGDEYPGKVGGLNGAIDPKKCYINQDVAGQVSARETANTPGGEGGNGQTNAQTGSGSSEGKTCAVEKIGWIICPIIEGAAKMSDQTFKLLANHFLEIEPELLSARQGGGTITAWDQARNIANIMFVIAFLVVVYSQITGTGLNNYGIKRMLPRLIVAAIAVNISYYICQAMVDLSNLLGYNIMSALQGISKSLGTSILDTSPQIINNEGSDGALGKVAMAGLALAGIAWIVLAPMGGIILFILITMIAVIVILLLRKAFIVLLVVASPIAFVMYLLPNTEKYFQKWLSMFWKLLLVFPIVALLLGGGQLASTIILTSSANNGPADCNAANPQPSNSPNTPAANSAATQSYDMGIDCNVTEVKLANGEKRQAGLMLSLVAAGVAVAPLLAVWSVLQGALAAAGAIGGKIGGMVQKGASSGVGGAAGWAGKNTAIGRGMATRKAIKQNYKNERFAARMGGKGPRSKLTQTMARGAGGNLGKLAEKMNAGNIPIARTLTGGIRAQNSRLSSNFTGAQEKIDSEGVKNELTAIEYSELGKLGGASAAFQQAIASNDGTKARAAISALMTTGEKGIKELSHQLQAVQMQANATGNHQFADGLKEYMLQAHGNVKEKNAAISAWTTSGQGSTTTVADHAANASTYAGLSDAQFASQTTASLESTGARAAMRTETQNADGRMETRGHRLLSNPENAKNFSDEKRTIISNNGGNIQPY